MDGDALVSVVSLLSALLSVPPAQPARPPALQSPARPAHFSSNFRREFDGKWKEGFLRGGEQRQAG
jgi:hypothetical protein